MSDHSLSSIPLVSLQAVAFDSETTGLDVTKERMIQLGGVRINHAVVDAREGFSQLLNPGITIPPKSQAIHGISDEDVRSAAGFVEVYQAFNEWRGDLLLIGYASGFDLAILKREHQLAGMEWRAPRCLDVRYLAKLVAPTLPDLSLDHIAAWLGVEFQHRHSALGDALATAEIFIALLPRLRQYGIRTLGEAERACRRFSEGSSREQQLGWELVHQQGPDQPDHRHIDSFPFRHRLAELMSSPALFIAANMPLREALAQMIDAGVSSLYVNAREAEAACGIVTERDLLRCIREHDEQAFDTEAGDIAQFPLLSLDRDAFAYRAIARMQRRGFRHLGVHDSQGQIIGALSARDLLSQRTASTVLLGDDIDSAANAADMAAVWGNIAQLAHALSIEEMDARDIAAVISRELCALTRQACILAEQQMPGPPPCAYAMLVLGSGGRGESMLAMDQDNAIVYAQGESGGVEDEWFAQLAVKVSDMLDIAGVPYCKGNIMASNPEWRHSSLRWQQKLQTWLRRQSPDDILNCDIFFDAVCVHGDRQLASQLFDQAFALATESTAFIKLMSVNACKNSPPLGLFGRFKLDQGRMDLKMGGIMPLFSTARVLAIKHNIQVNGDRPRSTPARLLAVSERLPELQSSFEKLDEAHRIIFGAILQQQLRDIESGVPPSNRVSPESLDAALSDRLGWALKQVPNVSNLLGDPLSA